MLSLGCPPLYSEVVFVVRRDILLPTYGPIILGVLSS